MRAIVLAVLCGSCTVGCDDRPLESAVDAGYDDAPSADAASPGVTVRVTVNGARVAGVRVIVHDASGTPLSTMETLAGTDPIVEVPSGGMVTVIEPAGLVGGSVTVTQVEPGDVLDLPLFAYTPAATFSLQLSLTPHPSTAWYLFAGGCGGYTEYSASTGTTGAVGGHDGCLEAGNYPLLVTAYATGGAVLAWLYGSYPPSVTTLSASTTPALPAWSTAFETFAISVDGVTDDVTLLTSYPSLAVGGALANAIPSEGLVRSTSTATQSLKVPSTPNGRLLFGVRAVRTSDVLMAHKVGPSNINPSPLVLTAALPTLSALALDVSTPTRPRMSWTRAGAVPDVTVSRFARADGRSWYVVVPPDAAEVAPPTLPVDLAAYNPNGSATADRAVASFDLPGSPSPAEARATSAHWWAPVWWAGILESSPAYVLQYAIVEEVEIE